MTPRQSLAMCFFGLMAALSPPVMAATAALAPATLGVVTWVGYAPIYCAIANGDYRKYGFDVRMVTFADNSMMPGAVQGNEVDASMMTYDQVIASDSKGWKLRAVLPVDYSVGGDAIIAAAGITSVKQLKGRKVAFTAAGTGDFLLGYALAQEGMSEADISPVNTTPEGVVGIMAGGSADVGVTYEPSVSVLIKSGGGKRFHVLLSSRQARGMITDLLVFKESVIEKNPKLVEAMIRGTLDGVAFMQKDPAKAAVIIAKALEISLDDLKEQLPSIENPTLEHAGDVFQKSEALPSLYASGKLIGEILLHEKQIDHIPPIENTYNASFVAALQSRKGE